MIDNSPLVSVIVVTYNCDQYVIETLESIKDQTYQNIELIVSDDGSVDNTVKWVDEWIEKNKDRFKRCAVSKPEKNTGTSANYNRGLRLAQGEWIKFIAGDDALFPYTLEEYFKYIQTNPAAQAIHSDVVKYYSEFTEENRMKPVESKKYRINRDGITAQEQFQISLRISNVWVPTVMIKRNVFDIVGDFDEDNHLWEDRPMWTKITHANIKLEFLDILGAKYRVRADSVQQKSKKKIYPRFFVQVNRVSYHKFLKHFPFFERQMRRILYGQVLLVDKWGVPNTPVCRALVQIFRAPFNVYVKSINKKYV